MRLYSVVDLITGIFEAITAFMLFDNYLEKRADVPKYLYYIGIIVLAIGINICNKFFSYNYLNLIGIAIMMILATFLYIADIKSRVLISILSLTISACSEIIILFIISLLKNVDKTEVYMNPQLRFMGIILSKALNLAIVKITCLLSHKHTMKMPLSYWVLYTTVFVITLSTIYLIFSVQVNNSFTYISVFCAIGLLYSVFIILYLYERMAIQADKLKEKELMERQFNYQVNHLKELMLAQEQISVYHDLSNHMLSLKSYMDSHNYKEGNDYLKKLMEKIDLKSDIIDTGNTVIDAVITAKQNLARNNDIDFTVHLQIPTNLQIDSSDICVVLGNALDNAIEACEKQMGRKYINMRIVYHENILSCKITNPVLPEDINNTSLKTTKQNAEDHGIGIKNIKRTLEKYKSIYRMEYDAEEFVFSFMIYDITAKSE